MGPLLPMLCDGRLALPCVPWLREVCPIQWKTDLRGSSELIQCAGPAAKSRDPGIYLAVRSSRGLQAKYCTHHSQGQRTALSFTPSNENFTDANGTV